MAVFCVDFQTNANKVSAGGHALAALVEAVPVQAILSAGARAFASQRPQPSAAQVKELYAQLTALLNGEDLGRYIDSVVDAVAVGRAYDRGYDDVA